MLGHARSLARDYRLPQSVLDWLDQRHVLRGVEHLNSSYDVLSCDVLIRPVLDARPWRILKATLFVATGITMAAIFFMFVGYVALLGLAQDYTKMNEFVNGDAGIVKKLNEQVQQVSINSSSEVLDNLLAVIINFEENFLSDIPAGLHVTDKGERVYKNIRKGATLNEGTSLTQRLANRYEWVGAVSDSEYGYDHAIKTLAAGTALSLGKVVNFVDLGDDDVWKAISAMHSPAAVYTAKTKRRCRNSHPLWRTRTRDAERHRWF